MQQKWAIPEKKHKITTTTTTTTTKKETKTNKQTKQNKTKTSMYMGWSIFMRNNQMFSQIVKVKENFENWIIKPLKIGWLPKGRCGYHYFLCSQFKPIKPPTSGSVQRMYPGICIITLQFLTNDQVIWKKSWQVRDLHVVCHDNVKSVRSRNWQKWKRVFLTCPCHKIYRDGAVGLKSCKYTWKITIFVKMWTLGQYRENLIFCQ